MKRKQIVDLITEADELVRTYGKVVSTESLYPLFMRMLFLLKKIEHSGVDHDGQLS